MDPTTANIILGGSLVSVNEDHLHFVVEGKPLPWKRPGLRFHGKGRPRLYNPSQSKQDDFYRTVVGLLRQNGKSAYAFEADTELEITMLFQHKRLNTQQRIGEKHLHRRLLHPSFHPIRHRSGGKPLHRRLKYVQLHRSTPYAPS